MSERDDALADLLIVVANRISRVEGSLLDNLPVPLTYRQYRILARVAEGHHTPQVLASFASLSMPTMSESISVLVRRGLLERHPSPTDRRAILVHITAEGRKALKAAVEALHSTSLQLLADVDDEEAKQLLYEQLLAIYDRAERFFPPPLTGVRRGLANDQRQPKKGKRNVDNA